jgi:hypothetical protein
MNSLGTAPKRPISLQGFVDNLPEGVAPSLTAGRFVFGSRMQDTLPYLVEPGAEAVVKPDEVAGMPVSLQAFVFTFDMSKPEDCAKYQTIMNGIASGWYKLVFVQRNWDAEKKSMYVYIEVVERHRVIQAQSAYDKLLDELNNNKGRPIT